MYGQASKGFQLRHLKPHPVVQVLCNLVKATVESSTKLLLLLLLPLSSDHLHLLTKKPKWLH